MGQVFMADSSLDMIHKPVKLQINEAFTFSPLKVCPAIHVPILKIVNYSQNNEFIDTNFKFFPHCFINLKIKHKIQQKQNEGVLFASAGTMVYGYKHKIKAADILRKEALVNRNQQLLFKRRIYGQKRDIIKIFAQMKLLSIFEIGPYIGRMAQGYDCYITKDYIEFFGELTLNTRTHPQNSDKVKEKVADQIRKKKFKILDHKNLDISFSSFQKAHIIKLNTFNPSSDKLKLISGSQMTQISVNNAVGYLKKQYDQEASRVISKIDKKTRMLSAIQNYVIQKNIDKAVQIFQDNADNIQDDEQKLKYAYQFCDILSSNTYFTQYEEQVITEVLSVGQILKQNNIQTPYGLKLQERLNSIKLKSSGFSSETQIQQFSKSFSKQQTSKTSLKSFKMEQLKLNIHGNNRKRAEQIMADLKKMSKQEQKINTDQYHTFNIQFQYGTILMKSGKSRHALILFQTLNRSEKVPLNLKIQMYNLMGIIYFYRNKLNLAKRQFENCLSLLYRIRSYSPSMMLSFNNLGCAYYQQKKYDTAIQYFKRSLKCGQSCADYEVMAHSNKGMALIEKKMYKEAKHQFMYILKMVEPINNASIICKAYSNLGYLNMIQNNFTEALTDFQVANKIQAICLIPNGYKPSIFLHNNIAMVYYKKKQYRKALAHLQKCKDQIQILKDLDALQIHFNYAMTYQKCYFHQFALKHFIECRRLLLRIDQHHRYAYEKKIQIQIQKLNSIRIIEDSQESAHQSISSRYSSSRKYL